MGDIKTCHSRRARLWPKDRPREAHSIHKDVIWKSLDDDHCWEAIFRLQSIFPPLTGVACIMFYQMWTSDRCRHVKSFTLGVERKWRSFRVRGLKIKIRKRVIAVRFEITLDLCRVAFFWHPSIRSISSTLVFIFVFSLISSPSRKSKSKVFNSTNSD